MRRISQLWKWFRSNSVLQLSVLIAAVSAIAKQFSHQPGTRNLEVVLAVSVITAIGTICWMIGEDIFRKDPRRKRRKESR
jgi:hypothetical protein